MGYGAAAGFGVRGAALPSDRDASFAARSTRRRRVTEFLLFSEIRKHGANAFLVIVSRCSTNQALDRDDSEVRMRLASSMEHAEKLREQLAALLISQFHRRRRKVVMRNSGPAEYARHQPLRGEDVEGSI